MADYSKTTNFSNFDYVKLTLEVWKLQQSENRVKLKLRLTMSCPYPTYREYKDTATLSVNRVTTASKSISYDFREYSTLEIFNKTEWYTADATNKFSIDGYYGDVFIGSAKSSISFKIEVIGGMVSIGTSSGVKRGQVYIGTSSGIKKAKEVWIGTSEGNKKAK